VSSCVLPLTEEGQTPERALGWVPQGLADPGGPTRRGRTKREREIDREGGEKGIRKERGKNSSLQDEHLPWSLHSFQESDDDQSGEEPQKVNGGPGCPNEAPCL